MKHYASKPEHQVAYDDLCKLLKKHAGKLSALEMLAVASNMLGKLLAFQDQRITTPDEAKKVMVHNIEEGNRQAIDAIMNSAGHA